MTAPTLRPAGALIGSTIAIPFGLAFVLVNGSRLPGWGRAASMTLAVVGVLAAVGLVVARRGPLLHASDAEVHPHAFDRRYWLIVLGEAILLFGGLQVLGRLGHADGGVAWVATIVGLHFLPLARLWKEPVHLWIGLALMVLGLTGLVLLASGGEPWVISAIAGVGSGVVLFLSVIHGLATAGRHAPAVPS